MGPKTSQEKKTKDILHKHNIKILNKINPAIYQKDDKYIMTKAFILGIKIALMSENNQCNSPYYSNKGKKLITLRDAKKI